MCRFNVRQSNWNWFLIISARLSVEKNVHTSLLFFLGVGSGDPIFFLQVDRLYLREKSEGMVIFSLIFSFVLHLKIQKFIYFKIKREGGKKVLIGKILWYTFQIVLI